MLVGRTCKWGTVRSLRGVAAELDRACEAYPNDRGASIGRRIFVRRRPARAATPDGVRVHALADLYRQ